MSDTQIGVQLAASLGPQGGASDAYVQQLYCFHDVSFARFLIKSDAFLNQPIGSSSDITNPQYPYIEGGDRAVLSLDTTTLARSSIFDTTCILTVTIDGSSDGQFEVVNSVTSSTTCDELVTVQMKGTIQGIYQTSFSQDMQKAYKLDPAVLSNPRCVAWKILFIPSNESNNASSAPLGNAINNAFHNFFTNNELSTLFIVNTLLNDTEYHSIRPNSAFACKLGIAIAPSQDAEGKDTSNNIYVVVQQLPADSDSIDRSGPSAPYIQQWRIPGDVVDNIAVFCKYDLFGDLFDSLLPFHDPTLMTSLVETWPVQETTINGMTIPAPTSDFKWWAFDQVKGDFNWIPGPDPDGSNMQACKDGQAVGLTTLNASNNNINWPTGGFVTTQALTRSMSNRLYFTPGYTSSQGKDFGPRLPMQTDGKPKWSMCLIGKTNLSCDEGTFDPKQVSDSWDWSADFEVFWRLFFDFKDFITTQDHPSIANDDVFLQNSFLTGTSNLQALLSNAIQTETQNFVNWQKTAGFQATLAKWLMGRVQYVNFPTASQVKTGQCYFNYDGDLLAPFSYPE